MDKDSIRLVNIVPVVNGWKTAALKNAKEQGGSPKVDDQREYSGL